MRNTFTYTLVCGLLLAGSALAQSSPSRSSIVVGDVKADESGRVDIVRGDIQRQLNDFVSTQRTTIQQLQQTLETWRAEVQNICTTLLVQLQVAGATIPVTISVPAPGVNLPPDQLAAFCNSVIAIENPGGGNDPITTVPFGTTKVPPVCNALTQDLTWNGNTWECVNTISGVCAGAGANPPRWVPVN